jgi:hypothetical protein
MSIHAKKEYVIYLGADKQLLEKSKFTAQGYIRTSETINPNKFKVYLARNYA